MKISLRLFLGGIVGLYAQVGLSKRNNTYHFLENSAHFVLKMELLLSNFERKAVLQEFLIASVFEQ